MTVPKISKMHQRVNQSAKPEAPLSKEAIEAREKRAIKANSFWDDAEALYRASYQGVLQVEAAILEALNTVAADPARLKLITQQDKLVATVNLLTRDLRAHLDRLDAIHERHKDKSGGAGSLEDIQVVLEINSEYQDAIGVYEGTIVPLNAQALRYLGGAADDAVIQDIQDDASVAPVVTPEQEVSHG
jgi:hypothetical protein